MKIFSGKYYQSSIFPIILIVIICLFPFIFTRYSFIDLSSPEHGTIGNAIGGIITPFVSVIAVMYAFLAFKTQYNANESQNEQINEQKIDIVTQRFENKYFKMLDTYRQIVNDMKIDHAASGKKAFHYMYYEFRCIYTIFRDRFKAAQCSISNHDLVKVAYLCFYYGIENGANYTIKKELREKIGLVENSKEYATALSVIQEIINIQHCHQCLYLKKNISLCSKVNRCHEEKDRVKFLKNKNPYLVEYIEYEQQFKIHDGHMAELSSYFNYLGGVMEYVITQDKDKYKKEDFYEYYLEFLRSQMSAHEILLLYIYGVSRFNKHFDYEKYFVDNKMLKYLSINTAFQIIEYKEVGLDKLYES